MKKIIISFLASALLLNASSPSISVLAESHNTTPKETLVVNGKEITEEEFDKLLEKSFFIEERFAATAGAATLFIPGVGQAVVTAAGVVILAGVTITAAHWAYGKVVNAYKEHTKNKRKSTHDKHTKQRPGRDSEKKKLKPGWKPKNGRRP